MERENIQHAKNDNVISHHYKIGAYVYDLTVSFLQVFIGGASTWRTSFVRLIDPQPDEKIAEFCCGTGAIALRIAKRIEGTIWASDLSPDQIRVAVLKSRLFRRTVAFSVQDASQTDYPSLFFDKVLISGALHEIKHARRLAIYHEVKRVLQPTGTFYVTEPDLPASGWGEACFEFMFGPWNPEHDTAYELIHNGLEAEVTAAGFELQASVTSNFGMFRHRQFSLRNESAAGERKA